MNRFTSGPPNADIAIVGEAPGQKEMQYRMPFIGASGNLLDTWLSLQGIPRAHCFVTNVIGDRIAKNPTREDKDAMWKELESCKPKAILAIGNIAMEALTGITKITLWRGSVLWSNLLKCKIIPVIHPASVLRNWDFWPLCVSDVGKLKTLEYVRPKQNLICDANETEIIAFCSKFEHSALTIDVETVKDGITDGYNKLVRVGIGHSDLAISIPNRAWTVESMKAFAKLMKREDVVKIGHNISYDWMIFQYNLNLIPAFPWFDTMIAWHAFNPELPKALATVASLLTDTEYWKHEAKNNPGYYNALDIWNTDRVYEAEKLLFEKSEKYKPVYHQMMSLLEPILYMQLKGCNVNEKLRATKESGLQVKLDAIEEALHLNPYSPKQVAEYVYGDLGVKEKYNRKTGNVTTDDNALKAVYKEVPSPQIIAILACRRMRKLISTYLQAPLHEGRLKSSFNITGTETGRLSSSSSGAFGGTNMQNIPPGMRDFIIPDEGMTFVEVDLSQAEVRVVAWLSGDAHFMEFFESGADVHQEVANMIGTDRQTAKRIVHASNYQMGFMTCAKVVGCTVAEAKKHLKNYYEKFPAIKRWQDSVIKTVSSTRELTTPMGRIRTFYGRSGAGLHREAIAYLPQSTVADVLNIGWRKLYDLGYEILIQVHDSVLVQVPTPVKKATLIEIKEALEIPIYINGRTLVIPADVKVGPNWKDLEKVEL